MTQLRRLPRGLLLVAALAVGAAQLALGYLILEDRFSIVNLIEARTPMEFDSPERVLGSSAQLDLDFPEPDAEFEQLVQGDLGYASSDEAKFEAAVQWVHTRLEPDQGGSSETVFSPRGTWAASDILAASQKGSKYLCDTYARLTASAAQALGVPARVIWLNGHVAVEGFDSRRRQWIAADPTFSAMLVHPDSGFSLSYAEAVALLRSGKSPTTRILGETHPDVDQEASLRFLLQVLGGDMLVYVDGPTAVLGNNLPLLRDWLLGRPRGVRMVSEESSGRAWKRRLLVLNAALFVALLGAYAWTRPGSKQ